MADIDTQEASMWARENRPKHERWGLRYPSDQTGAEWALAKPFIAVGKYATLAWEARLREILDAVLYVLTTGCQWATIAEGFPAALHRS